MTAIDKLNRIIDWYSKQSPKYPIGLKEQNASDKLDGLIEGESLDGVKKIFEHYNGEVSNENCSFLGYSMLSTKEIKTVIRRAKRHEEAEATRDWVNVDHLFQQSIDQVIPFIPTRRRLGILKIPWEKVEFNATEYSFGGPYVYYKDKKNRDIFKVSDSTREFVYEKMREVWQRNKSLKDGDEIYFEIGFDGKWKWKINGMESYMTFTSFPENTIKLVDQNSKWIPLITDSSGNYLGIDYDPDKQGVKGQVINFGRDEENHVVISNSLDTFFDLILDMIENDSDNLMSKYHLFDTLKKKTTANKG